MIRAAVTWVLRCVCVRACVFGGVCVCDEDVSRMLFEVYSLNGEQKAIFALWLGVCVCVVCMCV